MKSVNDFFNNFMDDINRINVCKLGKVVKFYPETNKIDVLPLPAKDNSIVLNVPVAHIRCSDFFVYYPLKQGDKVVLLFVDNDTDSLLFDTDAADTERKHDISDCVAIGGLTLFNDSLTVENKEALCIQSKDSKASVVVKKGGEIEIKGKSIKLSADSIALNSYVTYKGKEIAVKGDATSDGATIVG